MARTEESAYEFMHNAFPVFVGSLASEDAEAVCRKNNLSFVELLRPFCQLTADAHIRDPVNPNIVVPLRKWKIRVVDIQSQLPPPVLVSRLLSEVVAKCVDDVSIYNSVSLRKQTSALTPWFEVYRNCFLQLIPPLQHEFLRDFLSCILTVSTKHPDPMHAFAALSSRQNAIQHQSDNKKTRYGWFSDNTFKFYLLLHDVTDGDNKKAESVYQSMKSVYGSHTCFMLKINSQQPTSSEGATDNVWSKCVYPFSDDSMDFDESDFDSLSKSPTTETNQKDADRTEEAILTELQAIEKEIEENKTNPSSLTFNDPLTNMHYDTLDDTEADCLQEAPLTDAARNRPRKMSERSYKLQEMKNSLKQFSYSHVVPRLNSSVTSSSKCERGMCLTVHDTDQVKEFIKEYCVRGLLPHIEKLMRNISEQILARKGIHKSIFHATKKWFGGSKTTPGSFTQGVIYQADSAELQHRKLGDLSFLVQHYELAYNSYHSAKREFNNDHAWIYFAGALEMAATSAFMLGNARMYPVHYYEASISTYLNTCRSPELAARACLMSTEALKSKNMYQESVIEFVKLTNEDSDLRSALLLEQAAHCFLHANPPMERKYAFHMILAGHRFSKAVQRKHALRCYINSLQVYEEKGWNLAEDHVNFIIGRQSFNLNNLQDAQQAYAALLQHESQQLPSQQASHFREFLTVFKKNFENGKSSQKGTQPLLPLPKLLSDDTRLILNLKTQQQPPQTPATSRSSYTLSAGSYSFQQSYTGAYVDKWSALEKRIIEHVTSNLPYPFKPFVPCLSKHTENKTKIVAAVAETLAYEIVCKNPLKIPLNLLNVSLVWNFTPQGDNQSQINNKVEENSDYVEAEIIENVCLESSENKPVTLWLRAKQAGTLEVIGLKYILSSVAAISSVDEYSTSMKLTLNQLTTLRDVGVTGMQMLEVRGKRLNGTKQERVSRAYAVDSRLKSTIIQSLPLLEATFYDMPITMLCGEIRSAQLHLKNTGNIDMKNIRIVCSRPLFFTFDTTQNDDKNTEKDSFFKRKNLPSVSTIDITEIYGTLAPGEEHIYKIFIHGLQETGLHDVDFLFYYEPLDKISLTPYRLVQQTIPVKTFDTLSVLTHHQNTQLQSSSSAVLTTSHVDQVLSDGELIISLVVENRSQNTMNLRCNEFTLNQITCFSTRWSVSDLLYLLPESFTLLPGETISLHLKTTAVQSEEDVSVSEIPLAKGKEENDVDASSVLLFMKSKENVQAVENSIGFLVKWETFYIDETFTRNVIKGETYCALNLAKETVYSPPSSKIEVGEEVENMRIAEETTEGVTVDLNHPTVVQHDFLKHRLCMIDVTLVCSNFTAADVDVQIATGELQNDETETSPQRTSTLVHWCGQLYHVINVPGNSTRSVTMHCVVTSSGVYDIQNVEACIVSKNNNGEEEGEIGGVPLPLPSCKYVNVQNKTSI